MSKSAHNVPVNKKRKVAGDKATNDGIKRRKQSQSRDGDSAKVKELEDEFMKTSSVATGDVDYLIDVLEEPTTTTQASTAVKGAIVCLGKVLTLRIAGSSTANAHGGQQEKCLKGMLKLLRSSSSTLSELTLGVLMHLVKAEVSQGGPQSEQAWRKGIFPLVVQSVLSAKEHSLATTFLDKFASDYDDIRYATCTAVTGVLKAHSSRDKATERVVKRCIYLLSNLDPVPKSNEDLDSWWGPEPGAGKQGLATLKTHQKQAQAAWLALLSCQLSETERQTILLKFSKAVAPWFPQPERLMDFLTDCYDAGGTLSLAALESVYYLIRHRNLDYPDFFPKLYSLLDEDLLHSKLRSRFIGLLNEFMSSTHLPAALVASFIKRLSRLALMAPPGAIVAIVPWVYNMLQRHKTCTFMLHRVTREESKQAEIEAGGMDDPFDPKETDPMETHAIDSCLWELESLQSHYHPNVSTLAKIISQQFTKQEYHLEDFLDVTYSNMISHDVLTEVKKEPGIEFEIPKTIFTEDGQTLNRGGLLLEQALTVGEVGP